MDADTIQKVATELAKHLPGDWWAHNWWVVLIFQAVLAVLTLAAAAGGAFYGEYLRTRGKNLATKADFDTLQAQQKATTELVETVKADVSQRDWAKREWTTLLRMKLQSLFEKMHDCDDYIRQQITKSATGDIETVFQQRDHIDEADRIVALYLPELKDKFALFKEIYGALTGVAVILMDQIVKAEAEKDIAAHARALEQARHLASQALPPFVEATRQLESAGRKLLLQIMGVAGLNADGPAATMAGTQGAHWRDEISRKENPIITMLLDGIEGDAEKAGLLKANMDAIATYDELIKRGNSVSFARAEIARVFLGCLSMAWQAGERGAETTRALFADMCRVVRDGRSATELFPDPPKLRG
jgi:hypothetical protein